ncbi:MAG: hypothetical protein ABEH80_05750 [Halobaculum sp.]
MSDDDSLFDSVRRTLTGPTPAERAATLKQRAADEPETLGEDDVATLVELLSADDEAAVGDALHAIESVADEQPQRAVRAAPAVVAGLSTRPGNVWSETRVREMSDEFFRDLARGSILLRLARDDPAHLDSVTGELAAMYTGEEALEPQSLLALAHVVAAEPNRTDLDPGPFADWIETELTATVESDTDELQIRVAEPALYVELLASLAGAGATETLELVVAESEDADAVEAAERALDELGNES